MLKGGPAIPPTKLSCAMLDTHAAYFRLLGASWPHFAYLAAFVVALGRFVCVSGRSGLEFDGFWDGPGRVLEVLGPYFSRFFGAHGLVFRTSSGYAKT